MNIENVREFALTINSKITEELFAENWIAFRIYGKWFMLIQLDAPEPRIAVKMKPEIAEQLRDNYDGVQPAYHMNKKHWSDLYLNRLNDSFVRECIMSSYHIIVSQLPKKLQSSL